MNRTEQQLIAEHRAGSADAFPELVRRYTPEIYRFLFRFMGNADNAEDVTQETFLKVWKALPRYRSGEPFRPWVFRIAQNTAIDHLRKHTPLSFSDMAADDDAQVFADTLPDPEPLPDELFARREDAAMLASLLLLLPFQHREVLLLRYMEEFTFDEIGKALGKPVDTVKSHHRRALIKLRTLFEELEKNPGESAPK